MRYFVTGGAGFVGSHVVDRLMKEKGAEVTVYDNLSGGRLDFIEQYEMKKNFTFIKGDLLDQETLDKVIKGHDIVHHLAANPDVRIGEKNPTLDIELGVKITSNVLEAMRLNNISKIAFSSSSVVYGEAEKFPTPEDYGPLMPISMYGAAKLGCEALITAYCHTFGFRSWIYRFANVIGPRGTHGILVDFINKLKKDPKKLEILGNGKQKKSYLTVEECVDAVMYIMNKARESVNIYNLGSDDQITVKRISEIVVEELGLDAKKVKFQYTGGERGWAGDVRFMLLDTKKIQKLGWKPKLDSEGAVRYALKNLKQEIWNK
jgi:UDP-glucose 4-epimerase